MAFLLDESTGIVRAETGTAAPPSRPATPDVSSSRRLLPALAAALQVVGLFGVALLANVVVGLTIVVALVGVGYFAVIAGLTIFG